MQMEDCNKIIKVNKEALDAYLNYNNESQTNEIKTIRTVLKALQEENKILQSQNETLKQERNHALAKVWDDREAYPLRC